MKRIHSRIKRVDSEHAKSKESTTEITKVIKDGHKRRRNYLKQIMQTQPDPIRSSNSNKSLGNILSVREKSNIKALIR